MARFVSMGQSLFGRSAEARYSALPGEQTASSSRLSEKHTVSNTADTTDTTTRLKVFASVSFYLVAALVVRPLALEPNPAH